MSQEAGAPVFSWDEAETADQDGQEDFLAAADAQDVPKACSLSEPDCDACQ